VEPHAGGRFGCHQFQEHLSDTLVFCTWFGGWTARHRHPDPLLPEEVGCFIPRRAAALQPAIERCRRRSRG